MPIKQAGKKALRQNIKHAVINRQFKDAYREAVKSAKKALAEGEKDVIEKIRLAQKKLDKAAKRGVIKKNTASRKLSRLFRSAGKVAKK